MKAHVFREISYSPSPITSVASNGSTIAVFRSNKFLEVMDSLTLRSFLSIPTSDLTIIQSKFRDLNTLVALSDSHKIMILDVTTLELEIFDLSALHMDLIYTEAAFSTRLFYFATKNNQICVMRGSQQTILFREKSPITTIFTDDQNLIFATSNGWLRVLQKNQLAAEINVDATINKICAVEGGLYAAVSEEGTALLVDVNAGIVLDTVSVRKHPLYAVAYLNGLVHMSGVDSRIICYSVSDRFRKCGQADLHASDVLSMAVDGDRILSAGRDSVLVLNKYISGRYVCQRVYERSILYGQTPNYFYVSGDSSINIYLPEDSSNRSAVQCTNRFNDKITFKVSENVLEHINQPRTRYPFILKFKANERPRALSISQDEQYMAYSTPSETLLYGLFHDSCLSIELKKTLEPSLQILFTEDYLVLLDYYKKVTVYSVKTLDTLFMMTVEDYRERVAVLGNDLILTHSKQMIRLSEKLLNIGTTHVYDISELSDSITIIPVEDTVVEAHSLTNAVVMLLKGEQGNSIVTYKDGGFLPEDAINLTGDYIHFVDENHYSDASLLFIRENGRVKKYEIGPVICGMLCISGNVLLLHSSWSYLLNKFKPSVFKEKYSNR